MIMTKIVKVTKEDLEELVNDILNTHDDRCTLLANTHELSSASNDTKLDVAIAGCFALSSPREVCYLAMAIGCQLGLRRAEIDKLEDLANK
jgi:hypothetical protein